MRKVRQYLLKDLHLLILILFFSNIYSLFIICLFPNYILLQLCPRDLHLIINMMLEDFKETDKAISISFSIHLSSLLHLFGLLLLSFMFILIFLAYIFKILFLFSFFLIFFFLFFSFKDQYLLNKLSSYLCSNGGLSIK